LIQDDGLQSLRRKNDISKASAGKIGIGDTRIRQAGSFKIGILKVPAIDPDSIEMCASEIGLGKIGVRPGNRNLLQPRYPKTRALGEDVRHCAAV
jgi:hypothetical protein